MDHCYDSSAKLNLPERPIRTYRRSSKPPLAKKIKVERNIKLEPDIEIVDDYTSSEISMNNQAETDQISIHHTYPPEMLVINLKDVMTSTHFDPELLSVVKPPSISETIMKSDGSEKEGEVSNSEQVEVQRISEEQVKPMSLPVPPVQVKRPEVVLTKSTETEAVQSKPEYFEALLKSESPEKVVLKPKSTEVVLLKPKSPGTISPKPNNPEVALLRPKSPEAVLVNKKCSVPIPLKVKNSAAAQVKPKLPRKLLPKPAISEAVFLNLTSSETVQSQLNTSIADPTISSVSEVVQLQTTNSEALKPNVSEAVPLKPCISKGVQLKLNAHEIMESKPGSITELKLAPMKAKDCNMIGEKHGEPAQPFKKPPVKPLVTETVQPHRTEDKMGPVESSEATLVKLKRKGGTYLVMTGGHTPLLRTQREVALEPSPSEWKTQRPDEILEPNVIKLNLPEYVIDYEPNSKAPAIPPVALLPLIPLPLPSIIDDEPPMIIDSVKHLQEQLTPLLPRSWMLRVEKDGIFAMLFAPGLTCAVQRAVYASYDGKELRFIVHGRVVPKDHSVYEFRLMKPPLALSVETVREFVDVFMGAIHSMIQHHVCIGINDEESVRERRNHPGCRLDDNFFGEEGYTKTLRSLQCAYLVWRKNTKRCSECLSFKTLWRSRSKRRSTRSVVDAEVREPKNRRR